MTTENLLSLIESAIDDAAVMYDQDVMRMILKDSYQAINEADQQNEALLAQVEELIEALRGAIVDISDWGSYASDYFREKNDLQGDLKKYQDIVSNTPQQSLDSLKARIVEQCIKTIIAEPEYISSSHSTRQGYVRAVNDMRKALEVLSRKYQSTKTDKGDR